MRILSRCGAGAAALAALCAGGAGAAEGPAAPDPVVATVGGRSITRAEVQQRVAALPPQQRKQMLLDPRAMLRQMVQEELLVQAAEAEKFEADPAVVARLAQARRDILVTEVIARKVVAEVKVGDQDVQKFYDENQARFVDERIVAGHIMVRSEAEAQQVLADLKAGKEFAALARERSLDPESAARGGDLGVVRRGAAPKPFEDAAFKLQAGELSPVVQTQYGFHIIQVREHLTTPKAFVEVKDQIREHLLTQKRQEALQAYLDGLQKAGSVKVFEDRLK
jgi:peptidyl-prolyl cis-trans isomerase C